ncbi:MAG: hypothetical protein PHZ26_00130 [Candidatus Gracilibacteria bacterium]|nr:hypothetical protein [Candidatus Gracilibacteria bacterium]MDD2908144.1 hypothetical protein [Candidatus Gracilibacteria bacterium]
MNKKIVYFEDERYERTSDYIPFGCACCELTPGEKVDTCMNGCYDEINKKIKTQKAEIDIFNSVECQKIMNETVSKLNNILGFENIGLE